jgi:hypothetical protein
LGCGFFATQQIPEVLVVKRKTTQFTLFNNKAVSINMKHILIAVVFTCAYVSAHAQSDWINIASSAESEWDIQPGSFEFSKTRGGEYIAVTTGKVIDAKTSQISLYKWYVTANDCKRKMGKFVSLNIDGTFEFQNDFVFGSGSIASSIAEAICSVADYAIKKSYEKGM